jgi:hypothetical protein
LTFRRQPAADYASSGQAEEAAAALAACQRLQPEVTIAQLFADWSVPLEATSPVYRRHHERLRDGLRLASMPEGQTRQRRGKLPTNLGFRRTRVPAPQSGCLRTNALPGSGKNRRSGYGLIGRATGAAGIGHP